MTCLELPQSTHVVAAFKTGWHHALIQTGLDAGQTRGACPDHCYSVHHGGAAQWKKGKIYFYVIIVIGFKYITFSPKK